MNEKVALYLEEHRNKKKIAEKKKKRALLMRAGLFEKVYSETKEEGFNKFDSEKGQFYKMIFPEISDEEYEEILSIEKSKNPEEKGKGDSAIAGILSVLAIAEFVIGAIVGGFTLSSNIVTSLVIWFATFVGGILLLGFAEALSTLASVYSKLDKK